MKVLVAAGLYPPEIGGPATYAKMLESDLPNHNVEVVTIPFSLVRNYTKLLRHFVYAVKLWKSCKDCDVIYALDPVSVGLPAMVIAKIRRKTFLLRLGGDYAWEQGSNRFGVTDTLDEFWSSRNWPWPVKLMVFIESLVARSADKVVVPSEYLKGIVKQWGVESENLVVIYSALFPIEVNEDKDELRSMFSYSYPTIVSSGRLVPWKGFSGLIQVVKKLEGEFPDVALKIIGDGELRTQLESEVEKLGLQGKVEFVGSVPKDTLGKMVKAADVFVLNTAYEGLSHQLIEVMDIGTPIVTTKVGGNTELIDDGVEGALIQFNDLTELKSTIARTLNEKEKTSEQIRVAQLRSEQFLKKDSVSSLVDLLYCVTQRT